MNKACLENVVKNVSMDFVSVIGIKGQTNADMLNLGNPNNLK